MFLLLFLKILFSLWTTWRCPESYTFFTGKGMFEHYFIHLFTLSAAVYFSYWTRQAVSFLMSESWVPHMTSVSHLFLLHWHSPYILLLPPQSLSKTHHCHHMLSSWHFFFSIYFSHLFFPSWNSLFLIKYNYVFQTSQFFYYSSWFICISTCHIPCTSKTLSFNTHKLIIHFIPTSSQNLFQFTLGVTLNELISCRNSFSLKK